MKSALPFLNYVQAKCEAAGIDFVLVARHTVHGDAIGAFDDVRKKLVVCAERDDWLTTAAHECAHMDQWSETSPLWAACYKLNDWDRYEAWLAGRERPASRVLVGVTRRLQRLELDAERRALRYIRMFGLTSNQDRFVRGANFGVWQYEASRRLGRWVEQSNEGLSRMPTRLMRASEVGELPADFALGG